MKSTAWFYKTQAWQDCRASYLKRQGGLCEVCLSKGIYTPAEIVHHKVHITAQNVNDPEVTLNHDNLQALCRECHGEVHGGRRYKIDATGHVYSRRG